MVGGHTLPVNFFVCIYAYTNTYAYVYAYCMYMYVRIDLELQILIRLIHTCTCQRIFTPSNNIRRRVRIKATTT